MSENQNKEKDIDSTPNDVKREESSQDLHQKCFQLCKDYLGGVWMGLSFDDIVVNNIKKGTNNLFYCAVNSDKRRADAKEPQEVVIKFYGQKHFITGGEVKDQRLTDAVIAVIASERNLGPKIYGLFEGGEIMKFYKHKCFRGEEQKTPHILRAVAQKLAQFHAMEVPIIKTGNWLFNNYDKSLRKKERFDLKQLFQETNCQTLMSYHLEQEVQWVKRAVLDIQSPYVFNQTDFSCPNILVTESDGIVLIDFEYSCYSFRGHDLGCIFSQWERSAEVADQPFQFPDDHIIKPFIDSYIEESAKVKGKQYIEDNNNSFEKIVKESKVFGLTALLSITFSILLKDKTFSDKKGTMEWAEKTFKTYQFYKQKFIDQGVVKKEY